MDKELERDRVKGIDREEESVQYGNYDLAFFVYEKRHCQLLTKRLGHRLNIRFFPLFFKRKAIKSNQKIFMQIFPLNRAERTRKI